ncbi:hypothetical protein PCANC_17667 [Puccinia coronata f. sp. avenae]|uniref:Uncharacterized protein n=1 Tax=Puccinia coronata f. sp. avenae TaxID=200324 RepID=A0A2N5U972_9BASI|nr:hypothetical protein PCANC_17667 [Puccinia coronata f. sp. avenae]
MVATHTNNSEFDNEPSRPASFTTGSGVPPVNPDPAATSMSTDLSVVQASCSGAMSGSAAHAVVPASGDDASDFHPLVPMAASGEPVPSRLAASTTTPSSGAEAPLPARRGPGMSRQEARAKANLLEIKREDARMHQQILKDCKLELAQSKYKKDRKNREADHKEEHQLAQDLWLEEAARVSVSAESLSPLNQDNGPPAPKKVVPKTPSQRQRIKNSIKNNLLFRNLDQEQ